MRIQFFGGREKGRDAPIDDIFVLFKFYIAPNHTVNAAPLRLSPEWTGEQPTSEGGPGNGAYAEMLQAEGGKFLNSGMSKGLRVNDYAISICKAS